MLEKGQAFCKSVFLIQQSVTAGRCRRWHITNSDISTLEAGGGFSYKNRLRLDRVADLC